MKKIRFFPAFAIAVWMLAAVPAARADDGHNHDAAPTASSGSTLPRFAAESDLFELVGVLDGRHLTLYLDRHDDGSPVSGARLELELADAKVSVAHHGDGEFEATLAEELPPGVHAISAAVAADGVSDRLAGELDIHGEAPAESADQAFSGQKAALWAGASAALLAALFFVIRRKRHGQLRGHI